MTGERLRGGLRAARGVGAHERIPETAHPVGPERVAVPVVECRAQTRPLLGIEVDGAGCADRLEPFAHALSPAT